MNVVIDSLSRSGTTLFSSILNTHEEITSTRGIFNECLSLTGWDVDWPKGLAKNSFFFESDVYSRKSIKLQLIDKLPKKIKKHLILNIRKKYLYLDRDKFFDLKNYYRFRQNKNINDIELLKLINTQKKLNNFAPDNFYQEIKKIQKTRILSLRWNQCLCYYKLWANRGNKWIFVKRDPIAGAISRQKLFRVGLEESIKWYKNYSNLISNIINDNNFLIFKIENLEDKSELNKVKKFLDLNSDLKIKNIIGTDNQPYRAETSNLKNRFAGELKDSFDIEILKKYNKDHIYRSYKEKLFKELKFDFLWKEYFD